MVAASFGGTLCIIALFGAVIYRHQFRHREDMALLETRVEERTAALSKALAERSVMLRELHHRVKNNLQLTVSLLRLEADSHGGETPRDALDTSIQRIQTMALVHETLYDTDELTSIDVVRYARSLLDSISPIGDIAYRLEVEGPITVDLDFAVPFGLLMNELASDAARLAYPVGTRPGATFRIDRRDGLRLSLLTSGREIEDESDAGAPKSLALTLIELLVKQLHGTVLVGETAETRWSLHFPFPAAAMDIAAT